MTSEALATVVEHPTALAAAVAVPESKFALLRDTYAKGATPQEFELFVAVCNRLRLDPFARQIYAVKRWNGQLRREEMTPQVSIDGMRLAAERTGKYAGQDPPEWCGDDGKWVDVWLDEEAPRAARVSVYRHGFVKPITAVALYDEYVQTTKDGTPTKFWRDMPANQLAKCAESLALRKAFPNELSGVYTVDEMGQGDTERPQQQPASKTLPPPASKPSGPTFAQSWPDKQWASRPLEGAPVNVLEDYVAWCQALLADQTRQRRHKDGQKALDDVSAEFDRRFEAEHAKAAAAKDPVTDALEKDVDRMRGEGAPNDDDLPY